MSNSSQGLIVTFPAVGMSRQDVIDRSQRLDDALEAAVDSDLGELDGWDIGPTGATFYLYGASADALLAETGSILRDSGLGPAEVILQYGHPGDPAVRQVHGSL